MNRILHTYLFVFLILLSTSSVSDAAGGGDLFMPGKMGRIIGNIRLTEGRWVQYVVNSNRGLETVKLAVVGKATCPLTGKTGRWVEISGESNALPYIMKILVCGSVFSKKNVERILLKVGTMAPISVPLKKVEEVQLKKDSIRVISRTTEKVKVPAGVFEAIKTVVSTDAGTYSIWTSRKVPVYSLVKLKGKNVEIRLMAYGSGAKPALLDGAGAMDLDRFLDRIIGQDREEKANGGDEK